MSTAVCGDQRSWIHWSWRSEAVKSCLTWVLGTELGFSWRASRYSHWTTSPVPPGVLTCYTQLMIQRRLWGSGSHTEQKRQPFSFSIHQTSRNNSKGFLFCPLLPQRTYACKLQICWSPWKWGGVPGEKVKQSTPSENLSSSTCLPTARKFLQK